MTLHDLIFDPSGPYGLSREAWWTIVTTGILGGAVPLVWRQLWNALERQRWKPLRRHFGVMLSWDHSEVGRVLLTFQPGNKVCDDPFIKIQNEIGNYSAVIVSDSGLGRCVGKYIGALNDLWWWLDWMHDRTEIPERLKCADYKGHYRDLLINVNNQYVSVMHLLAVEEGFQRKWVIGDHGITQIEGMRG